MRLRIVEDVLVVALPMRPVLDPMDVDLRREIILVRWTERRDDVDVAAQERVDDVASVAGGSGVV
ncbi:hypothetical protein JQC91_17840 [Jannaschia sp. Os4]|uniref:hypothetical protein n=1 Tax=Jannaschia sp. Os4 TaxID=2807617 RepID=UPI0019396344|nr:hypothetical protein [Jannaschia sp. Os4]MBM2578173.1 hypothetical protein [Jannaschia sp. Os4]